jgi:ubiquinone/menaquinone biosynthesis C-methylase UbiE
MKSDNPDYDRIASNLRNPEGEYGLEIADMMNETNAGMIHNTLNQLALNEHHTVLELGPGNGRHCLDLLRNFPSFSYKGLDISETMIAKAQSLNAAFVESGNAEFIQYDGTHFPFKDQLFDHIFTVNTIYFWEHPSPLAQEIYRVCKPNATLAICYADAEFMKTLPFTQKGFTYYQCSEVEELLSTAGFRKITHEKHNEEVIAKDGTPTQRTYYITTAHR